MNLREQMLANKGDILLAIKNNMKIVETEAGRKFVISMEGIPAVTNEMLESIRLAARTKI